MSNLGDNQDNKQTNTQNDNLINKTIIYDKVI